MFNFFDLDRFAQGTPHDELARLRATSPVSWHRIPSPKSDVGFWLLTKHRDIVNVSRNTALFRSHDGAVLLDVPPPSAPPALIMVRDGFCHLDPPVHTTLRRMITPPFSARALAACEDRIRRITSRLLDEVAAEGECELVDRLAARLPVTVVLHELLGFDEEETEQAAYWGELFNRVHAVPPTDRDFESVRQSAIVALDDMHACAMSVMRWRRLRPSDDLLSMMAHLRTPDGELISEATFASYFWSIVVGAFDTTASTIADGMVAFNEHPEEQWKLEANPSTVPTAVEEMLRWVSPVIFFSRTASADTMIGETRIKQGDRIAMCYASANRDEDVFERPDNFDIARQPNDHLAFGHGPHVCLGAHIARLEVRILLQEMLGRRMRIEVCGPIRRARSNFINRITSLPARIRLRPQ